jgi:UDP-N-acetylmuramate dehydrogenase
VSDLGALLGDAGLQVRGDVPLGPLTTYRVGGPARWFVEVGSEVELVALAGVLAGRADEVLVVGRGSNLLVHDDGFDGVAVRLGGALSEVAVEGTVVVAGGAASLPVVARRSVAEGLAGFEWAVGVPGSVGGAVRMNAGGHGSDIAAVLQGVRVVDLGTGETSDMSPASLELGYRRSSIGPRQVVVSAELGLHRGDATRGEAEMAEIVRWRREHQPGGHNAGSVFTNPPDDSAGRLVDAAGCKGLRMGSAQVSPKHANFIQVDEGGSALDVHRLMVEVARRVRGRLGVVLRPETRLVGFPDFPGEQR